MDTPADTVLSSSPQPQPNTPPRKLHKYKWLIITLIIILASTTLYFASNTITPSQPQPLPTSTRQNPTFYPTPSPDPSLISPDWKTYTSYQYGFDLHYPTDLKINEKRLKDYHVINFANEYNPETFSSSYLNFSVLVYPVIKVTKLKEWINEYVIQKLPNGTTGSIVSGEITPYKNSALEGFTFIGGTEAENKYIIFKNEKNIFVFTLSGSGTGASYRENKNAEPIFIQTLSTFRLLDQDQTTDTTNWITYISNTGKYSIKYPSTQTLTENQISSVDGVKRFAKNTIELLPNGPTISFTTAKKNQLLNDYLNENSSCINITPEKGKPIIIDGKQGLIFEDTPCGPWGYTEIYLLHNNTAYSLQAINYTTENQQILSTFRFLDQTTPNNSDQQILKVYSHGGLCMKDQQCSNTTILTKDGSVLKESQKTKKLTPQEITQLRDIIKNTNFSKIKSGKFTDVCPMAYDGQEIIYTIYASDTTEELPSCTYNIDPNDPLFNFIHKKILQ
jgi:hypothetical protein